MAIENYLNELRINSIKESTLKYYGYMLHDADEYRSVDTWNREDVDSYLLSLRERNKPSTIELKKLVVKGYFEWLGKKDIVKHLHVTIPQKHLKREEILNSEDVNKMVEATESPMFKALIVFLFESGARISEALSVKLSDVQDTNEGMVISVPDEKTDKGYRRNIYPVSSQFIRNLILYKGLSKEDRLFPITRFYAHKMIKEIGNRAGIEKPVTCHRFRHAQATDMVVRGYQESIIRKKLGWTDDSGMIARYTHLVDEDVINATLEKNGQEIRTHPIINVNQAEPLNIIDAGAQLTKLTEENKELKNNMEDLKSTNKNLEQQIKQLTDRFEAMLEAKADREEFQENWGRIKYNKKK